MHRGWVAGLRVVLLLLLLLARLVERGEVGVVGVAGEHVECCYNSCTASGVGGVGVAMEEGLQLR